MKIAVIGTGMVGRLIAVELSKKYKVYAIDNNLNNLNLLIEYNPDIITRKIDILENEFLTDLRVDLLAS